MVITSIESIGIRFTSLVILDFRPFSRPEFTTHLLLLLWLVVVCNVVLGCFTVRDGGGNLIDIASFHLEALKFRASDLVIFKKSGLGFAFGGWRSFSGEEISFSRQFL